MENTKKKAKKEEKKKEEVCEIFDIEKAGIEKTVKACGTEEEKIAPSKEQIKKEKKIFMIVIIAMLGFILLFLLFYLFNYSMSHFKIEGVSFAIDKTAMMGKTLYKTSIPGFIYNGAFIPGINANAPLAYYNIYFRTDPRELAKIPFEGDMILKENMVLNMTNSFSCNGDGVIAIANVLNLYKAIGTKVIKDENASCDDLYGRYIYLNIKEGNETSINDYGLRGGCYNIDIRGCDILPATERFMLETLIRVNEKLNNK